MKKVQKKYKVFVSTIIISFFLNTISLFSNPLDECIQIMLRISTQDEEEYSLSENSLLLCEKILNKQLGITAEEIEHALPELITFLFSTINKIRAPRQDAPDSSDGAIVGPSTCNNEEVLQRINQLIAIIKQCCNIIQIDFTLIFAILTTFIEDLNGTFTVLQDLKNTVIIDFNGTFTALTACCDEIFIDFNGVFTTLTDLKNTLTIDFNGTFTTLSSIRIDINATFTALNDLESTITNNFNGTFTALAACCDEIFIDFNGVFTTVTDLKNTVTIDFNGTFTALTACCDEIFVDFNGVFTTITDLNTTLTINFNGTFTSIDALGISACNATPITHPIIITVPGYYCLSNDLLATLTIATSDVTVNLNNKIINAVGQVGIFITGGSNSKVMNGTIHGTSVGIEVVNTNTIMFNNLLITQCSDSGILLNPSCRAIQMRDISINAVANHGIDCMDNNDDLQCQRLILTGFGGSFGIGTTGSLSNALFEECQIIDSFITLPSAASFMIANGSNNQLIQCAVVNNQNSTGTLQAFSIGSNNSSLDTCSTQSSVGANVAEGYAISGQNNSLDNCLVLGMQSGNGSFGFIISGSTITVNNCFVQTVTLSSSTLGTGFDVNGSDVNLINCGVFQMEGTGFHIEGLSNNAMILNCVAARNNGDGFTLDSANSVVGNCTSFNNSGFGFNVASASIAMYHCFASGNSINNYSPAAPFVQPASQNTLVFARGNNFI